MRATSSGFLFGLAPGGVYPATSVTKSAVRSYRTISPLPLKNSEAVCFLLHWPSVHTAQALPGTLPSGARTFLNTKNDTATAWPTPRLNATTERSGRTVIFRPPLCESPYRPKHDPCVFGLHLLRGICRFTGDPLNRLI